MIMIELHPRRRLPGFCRWSLILAAAWLAWQIVVDEPATDRVARERLADTLAAPLMIALRPRPVTSDRGGLRIAACRPCHRPTVHQSRPRRPAVPT